MSMTDIFSSLFSSLTSAGSIFSIVAGGQELRVVRFSGYEAVSGLFEFRAEVAATSLDLDGLLDQPALLGIKGAESPRLVHGVVTEAEYVGETRGLELFELTMMPKAHRLIHRYSSRIFQDKTTQEIVTEVLVGAGVPSDWLRFSLVGAYQPRNYCVQYRESDLAFVARLLEEDGIFYFFEHHKDKHVMVMADHPAAHQPIAGNPLLWFNPPLGGVRAGPRARARLSLRGAGAAG
jgi:type VI secretion system secreted protein VgrG